MAEENKLNTNLESLFKGMDGFISAKTVVGEPIQVGDTIILPLVDVSFGVAAGSVMNGTKNNGAGGLGGKLSPSAVLVINNGSTRMVSVKNTSSFNKILDMVPDLIDRVEDMINNVKEEKKSKNTVSEE